MDIDILVWIALVFLFLYPVLCIGVSAIATASILWTRRRVVTGIPARVAGALFLGALVTVSAFPFACSSLLRWGPPNETDRQLLAALGALFWALLIAGFVVCAAAPKKPRNQA